MCNWVLYGITHKKILIGNLKTRKYFADLNHNTVSDVFNLTPFRLKTPVHTVSPLLFARNLFGEICDHL